MLPLRKNEDAGVFRRWLRGKFGIEPVFYRWSEEHEELDEHTPALTALDAEGLLEQKRVRQLLDQVLSSMSWELRVVFVMFELEGSSSPEIAEALGVSRGTVASRLRLAREAFRRGVERLQAPPPGVRGVPAPRAPQQSMVQLVGVASKAVS